MQHNLDLLKLGGRRYKLQSGRIDIIIRRKIESTEELEQGQRSKFICTTPTGGLEHATADTL